jgi:4-amino-4-deoxy-L-arabinose transferase-like glycosyltransferase
VKIKKQLLRFIYSSNNSSSFRLLLIAKIPLLDKTEARYAEIARIMWDTNKWIMPQIDYGIPFKGKTTVINLALSPKLHHFA